jgi:hypothetical protein
MQTPSHSTGIHCHAFDTDLLKQIIEVGVDTAVRELHRERGIELEAIDQSAWVHTILSHISEDIMRMASNHELLPADIDEEIDTEIAELVDRETHKPKPKDCASMIRPMHGFLRLPHHAGLLWKRMFEKRSE